LVVIAIFLICASTGANSWMLAALGVAIMAAGVALYVVSAVNSREFAYIPGTAHVVSCSPPPASASQGRCEMHLVVHAPGTEDVAVKVRDAGVPVAKWPDSGSTLPILVAIGDPRRVRVLWDNVRSHSDVADSRSEEDYDEQVTMEDAYLDDLLDEYDDEELPDIDPEARVIELDVMDPTLFRNEPATAIESPEPAAPQRTQAPADDDQPVAGERADSGDRLAGEPVGVGVTDAKSATTSGARSGAAGEDAPTRPRPRPRPSPRPRRPADDHPAGDHPANDRPADGAVKPPAPPTGPAAAGPRPAEHPPPSPPAGPASSPAAAQTPAPPPAPAPSPAPAQRTGPDDAAGSRNTITLRIQHVLPAEPAVAAIPTSSVVGDVVEDGEISGAYQAVTPPPGQRGPAARVSGVGVTLFVVNLGRSVAFYRDLLGFVQVDVGVGTAVLEFGGGRIVLRRVADMPPVDRRLVHLLLEVPDVREAYEDLRARGVEFVHRPRAVSRYEQLELWSAAFRDPDGHGIALTKWDLRR
jgi:catechol 2,3-dioxygenase-like lactoylglutathione lyase family enzyme